MHDSSVQRHTQIDTHTHTHTHTYIYIYIYISKWRGRQKDFYCFLGIIYFVLILCMFPAVAFVREYMWHKAIWIRLTNPHQWVRVSLGSPFILPFATYVQRLETYSYIRKKYFFKIQIFTGPIHFEIFTFFSLWTISKKRNYIYICVHQMSWH